MQEKDTGERPSFIMAARRTQIINATIATLDEIGYVKASLAQIAARAGISTALISYHFTDKSELMDFTLMALVAESAAYIMERTAAASGARDKLHAYIMASMAYQATHPLHFVALLEIVFNARTQDNVPYYKLEEEGDEDAELQELYDILRDGQEKGIFRAVNIPVTASAIRGAIGEYLLNQKVSAAVDAEGYGRQLVEIFDNALLLDARGELP